MITPLLAYGSIILFALRAALAVRDVRLVRQGQLLILVLLSQLLLALTAPATPISVKAPFMRFAQWPGLLLQPATAASCVGWPAAMFSPAMPQR